MIRNATAEDFVKIFNVINDAAIAYKGVIPPDRWHEPYMTKEELREQIEDGVRFYCYLNPPKNTPSIASAWMEMNFALKDDVRGR